MKKKTGNKFLTPKQFCDRARKLARDVGKKSGMTKREQRIFAALCLSSIGIRYDP